MPSTCTIDRNPKLKGNAIRLLAEGKTLKEAADILGPETSVNKLWRLKNKDEVRKEIDRQAADLLSLTPKAVDTYNRILDDAKSVEVVPHLVEYQIDDPDKPGEKKTIAIPADAKVVANNIKLLATAKDAAKDILQTGGILAAPTESRTIIAILSGEAAEGLTPVLSQLMGQVIGNHQAPDALAGCIDITPEDGD